MSRLTVPGEWRQAVATRDTVIDLVGVIGAHILADLLPVRSASRPE